MARLKLVQNDTRPPVLVQLTTKTGPIGLSTATVVMFFRKEGEDDILLTLTGTKLPGTLELDGITPDLSQYTTAGEGGRVSFSFPIGSLDLEPGYYEGEIQVTFVDGSVQTPFAKLKFNLRQEF